jgi:hypothetical protein
VELLRRRIAQAKPTELTMHVPGTMWLHFTPAVLVVCGWSALTARATDQNNTPRPLPPQVIKAWTEPDPGYVRPLWIRADTASGVMEDVPEDKVGPGDIPAFLLLWKEKGQLRGLADPGVPFGLCIRAGNEEVTDETLKELAALKSLQELILIKTEVTDAGLKELAGLENLQTLNLYETKIKGAGLRDLAGLRNLKTLNLHGTSVTGPGLAGLAEAKNLCVLDIGETPITDVGLKELAGLSNLQTLQLDGKEPDHTPTSRAGNRLAGLKKRFSVPSLPKPERYDTRVTDAGLRELVGLSNLQSLNLCRRAITDQGLKELTGLKNLRALYLAGTQITDGGLKEVAALNNLQTLHLGATHISDTGLKQLVVLKNLQSLYLGGTRVSDLGLKDLAELKDLQSLNLDIDGVQITQAAVSALQKELPACRISSSATIKKRK